jgi:hypothetical protein
VKTPTIRELRKLQEPYVSVEYAGACFGMGKTQSYDTMRAGKFPVEVLSRGRRHVVPTMALLRVLGIEPEAGKKAS